MTMTANELKLFYMATDITDVSSVQSAIHEIKENVYVAGKESYLTALNEATPANISKARKYNNKTGLTRNLGWIIMACSVGILTIVDPDDTSTFFNVFAVIFWIGIGIQIHLAILKSAWKKLTINGTVIHPTIANATVSTYENVPTNSSAQATAERPQSESKYVFCSQCGRKNAECVSFCENCGSKL